MTVAELLALLQNAPGNLDVVVRAVDDGGSDYCGTVGSAEVEVGAEGETFFAIDCGPEESDDGFEEDDEAGEDDEADEEEEETDEADEADEEDPKPS